MTASRIVTLSRTWGDAMVDAALRASAEGRSIGIIPDPSWGGTFDLLPMDLIMGEDALLDSIATVVDPDPDMVAMLAESPVDVDAVLAFRSDTAWATVSAGR